MSPRVNRSDDIVSPPITTTTTNTMRLPAALPFHPAVRPLHAVTYLLAVPLFSISFLVFLNSSLSFALTRLFNVPISELGSVVGTLGFTDELVAIVAAPLWGALSDTRLGTRGVSVLGYLIIAVALVVFVNIPTVYPGLVLGRIFFSLGAAAVATMVSAILPEMTMAPAEKTQERSGREAGEGEERSVPTGKLAGLVGLFTGVGALLALGFFLRLPTLFQKNPAVSPAEAIKHSYYAVGAVAFAISIWCSLGLAPPRNHGSGIPWSGFRAWLWTKVWGGDPAALNEESEDEGTGKAARSTTGLHGLWAALRAAFEDGRIGVGYVGGFVARASSVGISLFVPLWVNHYFISTGRCQPGSLLPDPTMDLCRRSYVLASELTGISQLTALLLAPGFGVLTDTCARRAWTSNIPLILSALLGILGFTLFSVLPDPEAPVAFVYVMFMGASQIGAIVASLGILSRGVVAPTNTSTTRPITNPTGTVQPNGDGEGVPLLGATTGETVTGREAFKGAIAGVYSLFGGVGILILTKLGGKAFDAAVGAPFWMLAGVNALLLAVSLGNMAWTIVSGRGRGQYQPV